MCIIDHKALKLIPRFTASVPRPGRVLWLSVDRRAFLEMRTHWEPLFWRLGVRQSSRHWRDRQTHALVRKLIMCMGLNCRRDLHRTFLFFAAFQWFAVFYHGARLWVLVVHLTLRSNAAFVACLGRSDLYDGCPHKSVVCARAEVPLLASASWHPVHLAFVFVDFFLKRVPFMILRRSWHRGRRCPPIMSKFVFGGCLESL